ncbi:phage baseplate assembly protein V [Archangium lansingense]|uniref:Phage baseplate assembly protein V n=1 Tax=Archangium lansingense TaxID=2995310 RepID=A0ABT4AAK9_9BACT|nr:phage baseplate assembly protein V [Archangium lansinium]MCY1078703.1 phage baseplate assembly protein V [Archangium lansinium]
MNEQAILEVLERLRGRFYGKYRGVVTEVEEGGRGRIKAKVPAVLAEQQTGWCDPCVPYAGKDVGFAFLPEPGSGVWIEFEGGDVSHPIWTGCYWREDELPSDVAPAKKLIRTVKGLQLLLDDDGESITLSDAQGNTVTLDSSGITLVRGGQKLEVTDSNVSVNSGALEVK